MEITIGGKTFVPIMNGTFAHDIWITNKIREAGLINIALNDGETEDAFIERIAIMAFESGAALELLGGLFVPKGAIVTDWTPESAKQLSEYFGSATDPNDKKVLRMQIASSLFYFFVNALASSKTSLKSGQTMGTVERQGTEVVSATETGASLSAS